MTKICTKCKVEKPRSEFTKRSRNKDGLLSDCRTCSREATRTYRRDNPEWVVSKRREHYEKHKVSILAKRKAYYEAHKEEEAEYDRKRREINKTRIAEQRKTYREANKEKKREYYAANRESILERAAAYYEAHKGPLGEKSKIWKKANPEKVSAHKHTRRAKTSGAEGFFTAEDIAAIYEKQQGCCAYCRSDISSGYHRDHILSLFMGGSNWPSNIQLLCMPCNLSKGKKTHLEFILYRISLGRFVAPELIPEDLFI